MARRRVSGKSRKRASAGPSRKRRAPKASPPGLNPFLSLRLFDFSAVRFDVAASIFLVALVVVSRVAAFPDSIWEQDEAYLALGVQNFDPGLNHPHPPWFPLWLLLGKSLALFGVGASRSLQILSAFFSSWMIFPLVALWSHLLGKRLALGAALLFLFLPGSWMLAGRAFTGTAATALLLAALAMWHVDEQQVSWVRSLSGGILGAAAILIRPHFFPVLAIVLLILLGRKMIPAWPALAGLGGGVLAGFAGLSVAAGGLQPLVSSLRTHSQYHFSMLPEAGLDLATFGLCRYLGSQWLAIFWIFLTLTGILASLKSRSGQRASSLILSAGLAAVVLEVLTVANPAHARYFVPVAALSVGFVLYALSLLGTRSAAVVAAAAVLASGLFIIPELSIYRSRTSPPLAALRYAANFARTENRILVVDRTLISFLDYVNAENSESPPVVFGFQILDGSAPPPPPDYSIAVYDRQNHEFVAEAPETTEFRCDSPVIRQLGQGRFLDLVVATRPVFKGWKEQSMPYIIVGP